MTEKATSQNALVKENQCPFLPHWPILLAGICYFLKKNCLQVYLKVYAEKKQIKRELSIVKYCKYCIVNVIHTLHVAFKMYVQRKKYTI